MPKSKYAPALFEVIAARQEAKTSGKLQIPKWWKSNKTEQPEAPQATGDETPAVAPESSAPASDSAAAEDYSGAPEGTASPAPAQPRFWWRQHSAEASETERPPVLQGCAGRMVLSLTPIHATIACGAVLLALFTCFEIGRYTGRSAAPAALAAVPDDLEKALQQPPNPSVLNVHPSTPSGSRQPTRASGNAPARPTEPAVKPVAAAAKPAESPAALAAVTPAAAAEPVRRGPLTYVVLETFAAEDKSAADFAQKWLEGKGVATRVEQKGTRWRLVSADGFDCTQASDEQRCTQYCEQVKTLGKACSTELRRARLSIYNLSKPLKVRSE